MSAVSGEALRPGRFPVLAKYDVLEELGHGGMATVYRAHDKRLGRDVAVKVIHPHLRDSGEVARRFSIEAQAVAKLRHPNIVEVYDVSAEGEGEQYLVVELLRGRTLRKMLQAEGALPPEVAAAIGVELLGALAHAHEQGVVHRDVKPENVIIEHRDRDRAEGSSETPVPSSPQASVRARSGTAAGSQPGSRVSVKLTDFGIAKLLDAQGMTSTGQVLGSPAHMAPEQIEGQDVDGRADVFGMGVLLYECMVGHLPFEGNNPAQVLRRVLDGVYPSAERERPTVGRVWSEILDKALGRTPEERYADADAMGEALHAELKRLGVSNLRGEIEAFCDDPKGYTERHEKKTIALLCDRALAARKRGDALAAAADYNRALAYAPHDPSLLRIVSTLHGAEARRRMLRRVAPLAGTLLLGALAFGVTRKLRSQPVDSDLVPARSGDAVDPPPLVGLRLTAPATQDKTATPIPGTTAPAPVTPTRTQVASGTASDPGAKTGPAPGAKGTRTIRFSDVFPNNIVDVAVDGVPAVKSVSASTTLSIDDDKHTLTFSCRNDMCKPTDRAIEAGQAPAPLSVRLDLRAATLRLVNPKRNSSYESDTGATIVEGDNVIEMKSGKKTVTLVELPSGNVDTVTLVPGKKLTVDPAEFRPPGG